MSSEKLPYSFDLHWDVKTLDDVERIAKGQGHCSSARPEDLVELFLDLEMEVPACLEGVNPMMTIWICQDHSWQNYQPLPDEIHKYHRTRVRSFDRNRGDVDSKPQ